MGFISFLPTQNLLASFSHLIVLTVLWRITEYKKKLSNMMYKLFMYEADIKREIQQQ